MLRTRHDKGRAEKTVKILEYFKAKCLLKILIYSERNEKLKKRGIFRVLYTRQDKGRAEKTVKILEYFEAKCFHKKYYLYI